jgi:meiotically up-regulated gene 157 (Mug157) protein
MAHRLLRLLIALTAIIGIAAIVLATQLSGRLPQSIELSAIDRAALSFRCEPSGPVRVHVQTCLDGQLETMFENALTDAEHQSQLESDGTVFVQTGDIPYQWERDSSAQVTPYLYFAKDSPAVATFLNRVIERQAKALERHPYAAAFNIDYSVTWPRYELDSLLYPIQLAWQYWQMTGDNTVFTSNVYRGFAAALKTMLTEQNHNTQSKYTDPGLVKTPVAYTGMIWSAFRPSDLGMVYNYNIPGNMMAVVVLKELAQIEADVYHDSGKAAASLKLSSEVDQGIKQYGIVHSAEFGQVYAYEVDGLGHYVLMDDANIPSLLAAPYIGYVPASDPTYQNTRRLLLSPADPYFYAGSLAGGIGSNNSPPGTVWPLSLLAQGLTTTGVAERQEMLKYLLASDPGDHLLHESFNVNNQKILTRPDFGWPNSLFAQFIMVSFEGYEPLPHL